MTDHEQINPPSILFDGTEHLRCPYMVGNVIELRLKTSSDGQMIGARIIKIFEPFTWSCAMVVRPVCPTTAWGGDMVLKLFDRRFAMGFRKSEEISPWSLDIEQNYHQFILNGDAAKLVTELTADRGLPARDFDVWNSSQEETYLHDFMQGLYETETQVYNTLADLQGSHIPQLFSCVTMPLSTPVQNNPLSEYIDIPGILLQYVEGFPLTDIATCAPRDSWQSICEDTIRIVNLVGDRGILNEDVKTRSFVVQKCPENQFQVFMIDFALCDFRQDYPNEIEWEKYKAREDEEGAVGYVMQKKLQGGFVYHRSALYTELDKKYRMDV
ncbi:hypothetical protein N7466_002609 [Penicillium verhagenii]|uniref:uncharacterized protein n=1 Tax=Penicillium verhagenii TaxID=1562060 RepID=UPI0025458421|nr:uncharacterized protein N7466_002609 [Penicillium verhagenii]KAJ5939475.1 hypothetical protein N7466_002609 [Penicillium verhagenii]